MTRRVQVSRVDRTGLPQVLLIEDVARLLRCSVKTVRRRIRSHDFPVPPLPSIDRRLRWSTAAVCDWIDESSAAAVRRVS
jgi:predicted DNA-binding transcriptional regulator AlpA